MNATDFFEAFSDGFLDYGCHCRRGNITNTLVFFLFFFSLNKTQNVYEKSVTVLTFGNGRSRLRYNCCSCFELT